MIETVISVRQDVHSLSLIAYKKLPVQRKLFNTLYEHAGKVNKT